jgi:hypothetical protein
MSPWDSDPFCQTDFATMYGHVRKEHPEETDRSKCPMAKSSGLILNFAENKNFYGVGLSDS